MSTKACKGMCTHFLTKGLYLPRENVSSIKLGNSLTVEISCLVDRTNTCEFSAWVYKDSLFIIALKSLNLKTWCKCMFKKVGSVATYLNILPWSQFFPENHRPAHVHWYPPLVFWHFPPFLQGLLTAHSSTSVKTTYNTLQEWRWIIREEFQKLKHRNELKKTVNTEPWNLYQGLLLW